MVLRKLLEPPHKGTDLLHGIGVLSRPGEPEMYMVGHDCPRPQRRKTRKTRGGFKQIAFHNLPCLGKYHARMIHATEERAAGFETGRHKHGSPARIIIARKSPMGLVHPS